MREEILHDLPTRGNWTVISSVFRADLALAFLCADPPTTSAVDLKGLLSLLVRDNSVSPVCLLGALKIMSGDSAARTYCLLRTELIPRRSINSGPGDGLELPSPTGNGSRPVPAEPSPLINTAL